MSTLHHWKLRFYVLAGCLLIGGLNAYAHEPSTQQSIFGELSRLADAIASVDHPDAGWVAALYVVGSDGQRAETLLQRSITAAPGDPVVAFAALRACLGISGCDVAAAAKSLREADPENGFSVLPELDAALSAKDESRVDAALGEMARGSVWRMYWNQTITRATAVHVLAARALPPADARELANETSSHVAAIGVLGAVLVPAYRPLMSACSVDRGSGRHARCVQISRGLQRGDAVITQSFGYSMELKLMPLGSPEHEAATQGRKELMWLLRSQEPTTPSQADEMRQLQGSLDREDDVFREMLRRRGKAIEPPPGWNPAAG